MAREAVTIEWDSNHARSQDRSQNERAHVSILTSVVSLIQSLPPPAPFKPWDMKIVLKLEWLIFKIFHGGYKISYDAMLRTRFKTLI